MRSDLPNVRILVHNSKKSRFSVFGIVNSYKILVKNYHLYRLYIWSQLVKI